MDGSQFGAVVDIHLPDMNGLVVSQKFRERLGPHAPIIVLSGDTSMETLNSLPHVGATYFFSKPVNSGQLLERSRNGCQRRAVSTGEWIGLHSRGGRGRRHCDVRRGSGSVKFSVHVGFGELDIVRA